MYPLSEKKQLNSFTLPQYIQNIWRARFFWLHLTSSDLRAKFRRSSLGLAWSMLNPLFMTLLLTFVLGKVFHSSIRDYAPYVFSGLITWEFITGSIMMGCNAFINAEGYIKQFNHPLAIYPLRNVLAAFINFLLAFIGLLAWVAWWQPTNFSLPMISLFLTLPFFIVLAWPMAIIVAFINTKFRDFLQLIIIILQALWYASPIFFEAKMFKLAGLSYLVNYNPIFHVLNLVRAPILYGQLPSLFNIGFTLASALSLWMIALIMIHRQERKLIFYL